MKDLSSITKTIIAAPPGLQGVFVIGGDKGDELYLDAVVALAIILHDQDEILDGKVLATAPIGVGLDGSIALATLSAGGHVHDGGGSWPNLRKWLADNAAGRPFMKDQFGDEPGTIPQ